MHSSVPDVIPFSSVVLDDRERTDYRDIESLANSIADDGLILPLILDANFKIIDGGRRHTALSLLISRGDLEPFLFHGETSTVGRPGFLVRGETSALRHKILELKSNLDRDDLDWRDALRTLVKAYRLARAEGEAAGVEETADNPHGIDPSILDILNRDYGAMLNVGYQDVDGALKIFRNLERDPKVFAQCRVLRDAYTISLKEDSKYLARLFGARGLGKISELKGNAPALPVLPVTAPAPPQRPDAPIGIVILDENSEPSAPLPVDIPLSSSFFLTNGLDFMASQPPGFCHHIVCDPDYALAIDVLDSCPNNRIGVMSDGVAQKGVFASLADLTRLIPLAYRALPEAGGFFIFWYSLAHHNLLAGYDKFTANLDGLHQGPDEQGKLVRGTWTHVPGLVELAGFRVQPHPLEWNKIDYTGRSNTAPEYQWPKSCEYAMVCRKGGARLTRVQTSSIYNQDAKSVTKALNHPFAKPFEVWRWIYRAIAIKGQRVFDPFVGSGSSAISAVLEGLVPIGCEIQEDNYNTLTLNLRAFYRKQMGDHITFS